VLGAAPIIGGRDPMVSLRMLPEVRKQAEAVAAEEELTLPKAILRVFEVGLAKRKPKEGARMIAFRRSPMLQSCRADRPKPAEITHHHVVRKLPSPRHALLRLTLIFNDNSGYSTEVKSRLVFSFSLAVIMECL
jgi:hypothetical protein